MNDILIWKVRIVHSDGTESIVYVAADDDMDARKQAAEVTRGLGMPRIAYCEIGVLCALDIPPRTSPLKRRGGK